MFPSCGRRIHGAGRCPTVSAGIVSPASIKVAITATPFSAPDDHLATSLDRRVLIPCGRCIGGAGRCPTVGYRIVSAACVQLVIKVEPAPDNDLAASPHCGLSLACLGGIHSCCGGPSVVYAV